MTNKKDSNIAIYMDKENNIKIDVLLEQENADMVVSKATTVEYEDPFKNQIESRMVYFWNQKRPFRSK